MGKPRKAKDTEPKGHITRSSSAPPPLITEYFGLGAPVGHHEAKMAPAPPTYAAALTSSPPWLSPGQRTDRYASEGDLLPGRPPLPPTSAQAGPALSLMGDTLGSLSQPFPPCLVEPTQSPSAGQASPLWETSAQEWDPGSLPQRPQAPRDKTLSSSPQRRESSKAARPSSSPQPDELQGHIHMQPMYTPLTQQYSLPPRPPRKHLRGDSPRRAPPPLL